MSLLELVNNSHTDKNTIHTYLPLYQRLLESKKESARNVLEVGVQRGGSINLWSKFFVNATVYGLDLCGPEYITCKEIITNDKIVLHMHKDAYDEEFFKTTFLDANIKCDMMLDDGPHTLESMKKFISLYSQIMTDDGILIIEDVQSIDWIPHLKEAVPEHLKEFVHVYDLRSNRGQYDDIVFTVENPGSPRLS
jgi:cyclopropane fatty-acyl-phospholipid synthase-like methyltransferase